MKEAVSELDACTWRLGRRMYLRVVPWDVGPLTDKLAWLFASTPSPSAEIVCDETTTSCVVHAWASILSEPCAAVPFFPRRAKIPRFERNNGHIITVQRNRGGITSVIIQGCESVFCGLYGAVTIPTPRVSSPLAKAVSASTWCRCRSRCILICRTIQANMHQN